MEVAYVVKLGAKLVKRLEEVAELASAHLKDGSVGPQDIITTGQRAMLQQVQIDTVKTLEEVMDTIVEVAEKEKDAEKT